MAAHWYTLRSKPHKERALFSYLRNENIEAYLPLVKVNPKNPRAAKFRPYFPGYLFVYTDLEEVGINTFNWMPGAQFLLSFDGIAAVVPDTLIAELQQRLDSIEAAGGLVFDQLKPGDKVRIKSGPFAGFEAIFNIQLSGVERVEVLLAFLSKHPHPVKLDSSDIEKI